MSLGYVADAAFAGCLAIPENNPEAPVHVCESATTYRFEVAGTTYEYDKTAYRTALSELLRSWMDGAGVPFTAQYGARIDFWVAVPEANPEAASARAVVHAKDHKFVAYLSLQPEEWSLSDKDVGVLGKGSYPTSFGYRAGSLVVQGQSGQDPSDYVYDFGLTPASKMGGGWYGYHLSPFAEEATKVAILGDTEGTQIVKRIEVDSIFEWIAWRRQGFVFELIAD